MIGTHWSTENSYDSEDEDFNSEENSESEGKNTYKGLEYFEVEESFTEEGRGEEDLFDLTNNIWIMVLKKTVRNKKKFNLTQESAWMIHDIV